jgi:hypothetical protein
MQFDLGEYVLPVSRAAVQGVHGYVLALGKLIASYRTRFVGSLPLPNCFRNFLFFVLNADNS